MQNLSFEKPYQVAIIEDQKSIARMISEFIELGYQGVLKCNIFTSSVDGLEYLKNNNVHFAIVDIHMPGIHGDTILREAVQFQYPTEFYIITGDETYTSAVGCFLDGARYMLKKPFEMEDLHKLLDEGITRFDRWKTVLRQG